MTEFPNYQPDGGKTIHFEYLKPLPFSLAEDIVSQWLLDSCHAESRAVLSITVVFCSDPYLQEINSRYLGKECYTDIISFPYQSNPIEGDLFVSIDRVIENAREYGNGEVKQELYRVLIHGVLHLCGYEDKEDADRQQMTKQEDLYLQKISILS